MEPYLEIVIIISIAIIMSISNFISHWISTHLKRFRSQILSFSAGLLVSILFIVIMEEVFTNSHEVHPEPYGHFFLYLIVFLGFLIFHMIEKVLYKRIEVKTELEKDLKELHLLGLFIDHLFLGIILATSVTPSIPLTYLILIPLFLESISSTISLEHIDQCVYTQSLFGKIVLGIAPLFGTLIALLFGINDDLTRYLLAFSLGAVLYIAIRDVIPHNKKGSPLWFLLGTVLTIVIATVNFLHHPVIG